MNALNDRWRGIARAAKMRDWDAVDAIIEDRKVCGCESVLRGQADARRELGQEQRLPALDAPSPVTIHDLPPSGTAALPGRGDIKIIGREGDTHTWADARRPEQMPC